MDSRIARVKLLLVPAGCGYPRQCRFAGPYFWAPPGFILWCKIDIFESETNLRLDFEFQIHLRLAGESQTRGQSQIRHDQRQGLLSGCLDDL